MELKKKSIFLKFIEFVLLFEHEKSKNKKIFIIIIFFIRKYQYSTYLIISVLIYSSFHEKQSFKALIEKQMQGVVMIKKNS